jgi:hypothetical protein
LRRRTGAGDPPAERNAPVRADKPGRVAARAGFTGFYTYDILLYDGAKFDRLCTQARTAGILCAPSVGPGYDAAAATGDTRVKPRLDGGTYDSMWRAANDAAQTS